MIPRKRTACLALLFIAFAGFETLPTPLSPAKTLRSIKSAGTHETAKRSSVIDDSLALPPAKDLASASALWIRSEEHTSELQSHVNLVCRLLLEKKKKKNNNPKDVDNKH